MQGSGRPAPPPVAPAAVRVSDNLCLAESDDGGGGGATQAAIFFCKQFKRTQSPYGQRQRSKKHDETDTFQHTTRTTPTVQQAGLSAHPPS